MSCGLYHKHVVKEVAEYVFFVVFSALIFHYLSIIFSDQDVQSPWHDFGFAIPVKGDLWVSKSGDIHHPFQLTVWLRSRHALCRCHFLMRFDFEPMTPWLVRLPLPVHYKPAQNTTITDKLFVIESLIPL